MLQLLELICIHSDTNASGDTTDLYRLYQLYIVRGLRRRPRTIIQLILSAPMHHDTLLPGTVRLSAGRVKCLSPSICGMMMRVNKNTAVCCLTAHKSPRNSSLLLSLAIYILRKMPTKSDESSAMAMVSNSCTAPRGIKHYGN